MDSQKSADYFHLQELREQVYIQLTSNC